MGNFIVIQPLWLGFVFGFRSVRPEVTMIRSSFRVALKVIWSLMWTSARKVKPWNNFLWYLPNTVSSRLESPKVARVCMCANMLVHTQNLLKGFDHTQLWKFVTIASVSPLILHLMLELEVCREVRKEKKKSVKWERTKAEIHMCDLKPKKADWNMGQFSLFPTLMVWESHRRNCCFLLEGKAKLVPRIWNAEERFTGW